MASKLAARVDLLSSEEELLPRFVQGLPFAQLHTKVSQQSRIICMKFSWLLSFKATTVAKDSTFKTLINNMILHYTPTIMYTNNLLFTGAEIFHTSHGHTYNNTKYIINVMFNQELQ